MSLFVPPENPETVDMYLWISHGLTVSAENNYYPFRVEFANVALYSKIFDTLSASEMYRMLNQDVCNLLYGICPYIPIEEGDEKKVYLPPLVFSVQSEEKEARYPDVINLTGLHFIQVQKTGIHTDADIPKHICRINNLIKVYDHAAIYGMFGENNIVYSQIFDLVKRDAARRGLNLENVVMGIASCSVIDKKYVHKYSLTNVKKILPVSVKNPLKSNIFNDFASIPRTQFLSMCVVGTNKDLEDPDIKWNALAGVYTQGCAMNVLGFYGIVDETKAREKTVCLPKMGTSIFSLVDYINAFTNNMGIFNTGYVITRHTLDNGINWISRYIGNNAEALPNFAIFFKLYADRLQAGTERFSHAGHTISIVKNAKRSEAEPDRFYLVDPQVGYRLPLHGLSSVQVAQAIRDKYDNRFHYLDIIHTVKRTEEEFGVRTHVSAENFEGEVATYGGEIVPRMDYTKHGGSQTRKTKSSSSSRKKSSSRKSKTGKSKSRNRSKSRRSKSLSNLDSYEQMVIAAEKKFKTPSALIIE